MAHRLNTSCRFALFGAVLAFSPATLDAADPANRLVTKVVEPRVLPGENPVFFTKSDRRVHFQIVKMGDAPAGLLSGASLTLIDPAGRSTQLTADSQGVATWSKAAPGVYAVVSIGSHGHAAVPLVLRERPENSSDQDEDDDPNAVSNDPVDTVRVPLIDVEPREVLRVANSFLPALSAEPLPDLDHQLIASGKIDQTYRNRVRLGADGSLQGRVLSVIREDVLNNGVAQTNIMIYSGDRMVARSVADRQGHFAIAKLSPGPYGLIAAGASGYAAFAFDIVQPGELVQQGEQETLAAANVQAQPAASRASSGQDVLPVLLIPQPMVPPVLSAIRQSETDRGDDAPLAGPLGLGQPGGIAGAGLGGAAAGAGGAAGAGVLGGGGVSMFGGIGAAVSALARGTRGRPEIVPPRASPSQVPPPLPPQAP